MALRDFKQYMTKTQAQYLEMKSDLADFNQALADGHITEEQLVAVKADVAAIEQNYQRLVYVAYLLEMPNKKSKKANYKKANIKLMNAFKDYQASDEDIIDENKSILDHMRSELKKLKLKK